MKMIQTHEAEAVVDARGSVQIRELPFATGDRVRVFVMRDEVHAIARHTADEARRSAQVRHGLSGTPIRYDNPTEPVGAEDWDLLNDDPGAA